MPIAGCFPGVLPGVLPRGLPWGLSSCRQATETDRTFHPNVRLIWIAVNTRALCRAYPLAKPGLRDKWRATELLESV
jgi:hypothetical protein